MKNSLSFILFLSTWCWRLVPCPSLLPPHLRRLKHRLPSHPLPSARRARASAAAYR